jgi:zeaxanthin epoxidase
MRARMRYPNPACCALCFELQIQSNALGALEALDLEVAQRVYDVGCITGDRINGLCDGVTGDW